MSDVATIPGLPTLTPEQLAQASTAYRMEHLGISVDGEKFSIRRFPYLRELFDMYDIGLLDETTPEDLPQHVVIRKGAQLGFTSYAILSTIDRLQWLYPRAAMYLFPTRDDVTDFSKARFDRLIQENDSLRSLVGHTDTANLKNIAGKLLYFRGARTRTQLKGVPVDFLVMDERDEMADDMVDMAEKRMNQSRYAHTLSLSTPTLPDFGTDISYQESDNRLWFIRCTRCNTWTCLEQEWPNALRRCADGRVIRACKKCHEEIFTINGQWVAAYNDRPVRGYYISQMNSSAPAVSPQIILDEAETGVNVRGERITQKEFTNQRLGLPYADIEDQLTAQQVLACCGTHPMATRCDHDTAMGVDVKKNQFHYLIGYPTGKDRYKVIKVGVAKDWDELLDIARRYHVASLVVDAKPEINASADFCRKFSPGYACFTNETQRYGSDWNPARKEVKVNRNTSLDESHAVIVEQRVELPRQDDFIMREVATPFTRIARTIVTDDKTGVEKAVWVKLGGASDDMRYAWNFFVIACERVRPPQAQWVANMERGRRNDSKLSFMAA